MGVAVGAVASFIDIGTTWMTDLKYGICPEAFWFDEEQCCWSNTHNCTKVFCNAPSLLRQIFHFIFCFAFKWLKWSQLLGAEDDSPGAYIVSYLFYVIWALSFAGLAAVLVRMFAPYASGGGIPEVTRACGEIGI